MFKFLGVLYHYTNVLATLLLMFCIVVFFYFLDLTKGDKKKRIRKRALLFVLISILFALIYTSAFSVLFGPEIGTIFFDVGIMVQIVLIVLLILDFRKELIQIYKSKENKEE